MVALASRRHYNNTSPEARLNIGINAAVTTFAFETGGGTGMPTTPFTLTLDYGAASGEEIILVNTLAGDSVTSCTRGYDGTAAVSHAAHALCVHTFVAKDADEGNAHTSDTAAHGVAGAVVGTTDAQVLTNKTISSSKTLATATDPALKTQAAGTGTAAQIQSRNSGDTVTVFTVDQLGRVIGGAGSFTALVITDKALIAKAFSAGQTASLFEAQNSSGTGLLVVDAKGRLRIVPTDNAVSPIVVVPPTGAPFALQVRDSADTVDQLTFDTAGQLVGATTYLRGFFAADVVRYPTDGSKFKVDTNGKVVAANTGGLVARGKITANAGPTSGTTTLTVVSAAAFTPATAIRTFKITAHFELITGSVPDDRYEFTITRDGTVISRHTMRMSYTTNGTPGATIVTYDESPAASSHVYDLRVTRLLGTGTCTIFAAADSPCIIMVEDMGLT